jgi:mono/diheme cytochrome c family protein
LIKEEIAVRRIIRGVGIVLGVLVGVLLVAGLVLYFIGNARLNRAYDFPPSNLTVPEDSASLELGRHRVEVLCRDCHGDDLSGIENWFAAGPLGTIDSANLTAGEGGVATDYTVEDYVRAIRHGIGRDGKPIFMTGVYATSYLSDEDLAAIIAYLQTVPPVDKKLRGERFTPLAKIMLAAGLVDDLPVETVSHKVHITAPQRGATAEYGEYMVNTNDCRLCHGAELNGGPFPDPTIQKISPNLTPGGELAFWTEAEFVNTMRTGTTPGGHKLDPDLMPWQSYSKLHDDELRAIWFYLESLPKLPQYTE